MSADNIANDQVGAVNRVADAIFALAKEQRAQTSLNKRAVEVSERMCKMAETNMAVSRALEQKLLLEGEERAGRAN